MPDTASFIAALLAACSVKLLDDLLDSGPDDDLYAHRAVYCALALCLACLARAGVAVPLFLACYAVGMIMTPAGGAPPAPGTGKVFSASAVAPAFLRFAEPAGAVLVLIAFYGPARAAAALLLALFAQLGDDILDFRADLASGQANLVHRFGVVECALAAASMLFAAASLEFRLTLCALAGAVSVWAGERAVRRVAGGGAGDR